MWVCCSGSTRRLNRKEVLGFTPFFFFFFFPGRDQYYMRLFFCGLVVPGAPEGSTGRRFPLIEFFGTYTMFKILIQPDVDTSYLSKILLLYGAKTNKTLV